MQSIKLRLFEFCQAYVAEKIASATGAMEKAQKEANLETKSSAGDKYETGRSMMQLEKEKYALHLQEALRLKEYLASIDLSHECEQVEEGAVVETDHGNFFFSIAAGNFFYKKEYICISIASPIGRALESAEEEDVVVFRDKEIEIFSIQ